jgi:serine/threonine protein kinase
MKEWTVKEKIGMGGMAVVHAVERNGVKAAMKRVRRKETNLVREYTVLRDLGSQAFLPQMYIVHPYVLVMERFSYSLSQFVKHTPPTLSAIYTIGHYLVHALKSLHALGWLHLDVKPSNVMMTEDSRVLVLIDFGLASLKAEKRPRTEVVGTFPFIGRRVWLLLPETSEDDLEAVALTLAWCVRGTLPWMCDSKDEIRARIIHPAFTLEGEFGTFLRSVRNSQPYTFPIHNHDGSTFGFDSSSSIPL